MEWRIARNVGENFLSTRTRFRTEAKFLYHPKLIEMWGNRYASLVAAPKDHTDNYLARTDITLEHYDMPSRRFITLVFHLPPFSQTTTCSKALRYPRPPRTFPFPLLTRTYATHREIPHPPPPPPPHPDLLSNSSTSSRLGRTGAGPRIQDSVGPFPLGVGPSGRDKTWRPWSELGLGGKCMSAQYPY